MNRKLIALNVALGALVVWAGFGLRQMWLVSKARDAAEFQRKSGAVPVAPLTPLEKQKAVVPANYKLIADKLLLHPSRNPDVIVDPPPPPPPEPPMPPLPVYHGLMNLGNGPTAFMGKTASSPYEIVHPGETIGEFKLLSVNEKEIELEWHGKKVRKAVDELTDNSHLSEVAAAPDPGQGRAVNEPPHSPPPPPQADTGPGEEHSQFRTASCQANDNAPDGTVRNGYRKTHRQTPFGNICLWEQVGQ